MTPADIAYERIIALTDQIGVLSEQLEIVTKEWQELSDAEA